MSKPIIRVRIVHDSDAEDPRGWDDMCKIETLDRWTNLADIEADLIVGTKAWRASAEMIGAATNQSLMSMLDSDDRLRDDDTFRSLWLELVKDEVIVEVFHTQNAKHVAHTSPELCKLVGTPWERAAEVMQGSVETFKQWAEGDVYGYVIEECIDVEDGDWIEVESCWGFYGSDPFENGMACHIPEELHDQLRHAEIEYSY